MLELQYVRKGSVLGVGHKNRLIKGKVDCQLWMIGSDQLLTFEVYTPSKWSQSQTLYDPAITLFQLSRWLVSPRQFIVGLLVFLSWAITNEIKTNKCNPQFNYSIVTGSRIILHCWNLFFVQSPKTLNHKCVNFRKRNAVSRYLAKVLFTGSQVRIEMTAGQSNSSIKYYPISDYLPRSCHAPPTSKLFPFRWLQQLKSSRSNNLK